MSRQNLGPVEKLIRRNKTPQKLARGRPEGEIENCDARRLKAWTMLTEEGKSRSTIARELNVALSTISEWLNHVHEKTLAGISQKGGLVRDQQGEQYDKVIERWMPLAVHEGLIVKGEKYGKNGELEYVTIESWDAGMKAAAIVLKAMEQKAKLYGLATVKVEHGVGDIKNAGQIFVMVKNLANTVSNNIIEGEFQKEPEMKQLPAAA